jgi:uncharacterized membrane protein
MNQIDPLLLFTVLLAVLIVFVFLAWYFNHKAKAKERLLIIEKGFDVDKFQQKEKSSYTFLNIAIVIIGLAIAFAIQSIMSQYDIKSEGPYLAVLFLCTGIAFTIIHLVNRTKK